MRVKIKIIHLMQAFGLITGALLLAACASKKEPVAVVPVHSPSVGEVRNNLMKNLKYSGDVCVIRLGEQVRIVLRSDYLFEPNSSNLRKSYKHTLNEVARLLRTYDKINVKVSAYTDNQGGQAFLQALTTRQAQVVANFMWDHGIDARLLYAVGDGKTKPVAWNGSRLGQSFNRRVEISFRYFPKVKSYE